MDWKIKKVSAKLTASVILAGIISYASHSLWPRWEFVVLSFMVIGLLYEIRDSARETNRMLKSLLSVWGRS